MMWQRAKKIGGDRDKGRFFWVRAEPPREKNDPDLPARRLAYTTNIRVPLGARRYGCEETFSVCPDVVELLPEFADHVEYEDR